MPRRPRRLLAPGALSPGALYHVTNRGVDRAPIFHSDLDRIVFLSMLADACLSMDAICHCFCLMTNHFHLILEDPRGALPQLMHRLESPYARYFNDTRVGGRCGPLFQGRYTACLIASRDYFDAACRYVLRNPLLTSPPLVACASDYLWSSAAFVTTEQMSGQEFCARLLAACSGVEGVEAALGPCRRATTRQARTRRLQALATGSWIEREGVLGGRSPQQYRAVLEQTADEPLLAAEFERGAAAKPQRGSGERESHLSDDSDAASSRQPVPNTVPASAAGDTARALPRRAERFTGLALEQARDAIEQACSRIVPRALLEEGEEGLEQAGLCYWLWRYTTARVEEIAAVVAIAEQAVTRAVAMMRKKAERERAWEGLLWRVEWALRWSLLAAPCRC